MSKEKSKNTSALADNTITREDNKSQKSKTTKVKAERREDSRKGLVIAICLLSGLLALMSVLYALSESKRSELNLRLEDMYQKSFYDLVDNVNNVETKLAKTISATDKNYQAKMLEEISKNASMAQENLNNLPYSINGLDNTIAFVNQTSGYAETLSKKLKEGKKLDSKETQTLENIYDSILSIKQSLNKMTKEMWEGYSIINTSAKFDGDYNVFTGRLGEMKDSSVEYPTMIYDGPFSDSQVNKNIKGLKGSEVSQEQAKAKILELFPNLTEDMIVFKTQTNGHFSTYDFAILSKASDNVKETQKTVKDQKIEESKTESLQNDVQTPTDNNKQNNTQKMNNPSTSKQNNILKNLLGKNKNSTGMEIGYIQITKIGGNLLTLSSYNDKKAENLDLKNAEAVAVEFSKKAKLDNMQVVWSDVVGGNAFINLAPVVNGVILYPDLVKLKIDLSNGDILGYEATTYYTNHVTRDLETATISKSEAKAQIGKNFIVEKERMALIPLDYGKEVLCHEFKCSYGGDTYYFYFNAQTGAEENILKIIETDNGNLLM